MHDATIDIGPDPPAEKPDRLCLFHVASGQAGYFTAAQARGCGFKSSAALLPCPQRQVHQGWPRALPSPRVSVISPRARAGRVARGRQRRGRRLARERAGPAGPERHYSRCGPSHCAPLAAQPAIRVGSEDPYTERPIPPSERWEREGITITSPIRSILDAAEKGAGPEQIEMAVIQAVERGLASTEELRRAASERSRRVAELIDGALRKVAA